MSNSTPPSSRLPRARSIERQERFRERAHAAPRRLVRSFVQLPKKANPVVLLVAAGLVVFLAVSIAQPLRNYFQQRAELARINATIASQEEERDRLTAELDRYMNEDYIKEQARTRLGLIEPGEVAFRILSPQINASSEDPTAAQSPEEPKQWYEQLWDSIAVPEAQQKPQENTPPQTNPQEHRLPILPTTSEPAAPTP